MDSILRACWLSLRLVTDRGAETQTKLPMQLIKALLSFVTHLDYYACPCYTGAGIVKIKDRPKMVLIEFIYLGCYVINATSNLSSNSSI